MKKAGVLPLPLAVKERDHPGAPFWMSMEELLTVMVMEALMPVFH
jgi:hypothetical protein